MSSLNTWSFQCIEASPGVLHKIYDYTEGEELQGIVYGDIFSQPRLQKLLMLAIDGLKYQEPCNRSIEKGAVGSLANCTSSIGYKGRKVGLYSDSRGKISDSELSMLFMIFYFFWNIMFRVFIITINLFEKRNTSIYNHDLEFKYMQLKGMGAELIMMTVILGSGLWVLYCSVICI